ncbi:hypothetical protein [Aquimarina muelleri]|uniref:Lipoprotein n=2 Tax=Aquimarina muelleri TaxID=279356 RepID=A0A918N5V6_9FLAO|nr:hypothetical protein [Aquimarina muelleri]MCX2761527.1 hypothetical protein [Aquimarina muelleri]GGX32400.1 hypothetical protein GCM10007384_36570 [Aquimarina muelleri]
MKTAILTILLFVLFTIGCKPQNKESMNTIIYKEKFINLYEEVKTKPEPPLYIYEFNYSDVNIEIYINNKLFFKSYAYSDETQNYQLINHYLNNELTQKLKIVVKPLDGELFSEQSYFTFRLSSFEKKSYYDDDIWDNEQKIINYSTDEFGRDSNGDFAVDKDGNTIGYIKEKRLEGKPYFEKEFEFEASIPFKLPNVLETSKDLRKLDTVVLKKQVVTYFNRFIKSVNNSDDDAFFWETMYRKAYLECMANYRSEEEINELYENAEFVFSDKRVTFLPLEDYEMVFYNEGRLVTLESTSSDLKKKGKSVLNLELRQEGKEVKKSNKMQFYFHIPKDSKELEVIF